jgi:hypothetical protein
MARISERAIVAGIGRYRMAHHGTEQHECRTGPGQHMELIYDGGGGRQVDVEHLAGIAHGAADPGGVYHALEIGLLRGELPEPAHGGRVGDVAGHAHGLDALCLQVRHGTIHGFLRMIGDHYPMVLQGVCTTGSQAPGTAGDQDGSLAHCRVFSGSFQSYLRGSTRLVTTVKHGVDH